MSGIANGNSFVYSAIQLMAGTLLMEGALQLGPGLGVFDTHPVQRAGNAP